MTTLDPPTEAIPVVPPLPAGHPSPLPRSEVATANIDRLLAAVPRGPIALTTNPFTPPPDHLPALSPRADRVHAAVCDCAHGADIAGHGGVDYEATAHVLAEHLGRSLADRAAGTAGAALGGSAAAVALAVLGYAGQIPELWAGAPTAGTLALVLPVLLPLLAAVAQGYLREWRDRTR